MIQPYFVYHELLFRFKTLYMYLKISESKSRINGESQITTKWLFTLKESLPKGIEEP